MPELSAGGSSSGPGDKPAEGEHLPDTSLEAPSMKLARVVIAVAALLPGLLGFALLWWNERGWNSSSVAQRPPSVGAATEANATQVPVPVGSEASMPPVDTPGG